MNTLPDFNTAEVHPILQAPCSTRSWVRVTFHGNQPPTRAEIFKTMELLEMMHNFWDKEPDNGTINEGDH